MAAFYRIAIGLGGLRRRGCDTATLAGMSAAELGFAISVFLACAVEAVEATTIVMAVGNGRSWSSALSGVGTGLVALAVIVAVAGTALAQLPLDVFRLVIGAILLLVGLQWLRKAILRAAGLKALHDENAIYQRELEAAAADPAVAPGRFDPYAFAVAFKGVLLEGLEIAVIVITFGADHRHTGLAAAAAGLAVLVVVAAGLAVRAPLARVPENTMKFVVGVMLVSFGVFWAGEGAGLSWPGGDAFILALLAITLSCALLAVWTLRRGRTAVPQPPR
jgi:uncharacterized membrane protein